MDWVTLNEDLLHEAFQDKECTQLLSLREHGDPVPGLCEGLAARIRAAVLANGRSGLQGGTCDIPQALRGEAVAILRLKVLTRYNLNVSEDRRQEAREAESRLDAIARGEYPLATSTVASSPTYHSRRQRFGSPGTGGLLPGRNFRPLN